MFPTNAAPIAPIDPVTPVAPVAPVDPVAPETTLSLNAFICNSSCARGWRRLEREHFYI